jgi:hypothetical protein
VRVSVKTDKMLSRIFLDHRIRRLSLLFSLTRVLKVSLSQVLQPGCHKDTLELCRQMLAKCKVMLPQTYYDLPLRGPFIDFSKKRWDMRAEPTSVESGRDFTSALLERIFTEASNLMQALLVNDSEQIKKASKTTWNSLNNNFLSPILDAWQTCFSDYQWISIVMLTDVRLVFSTVSCAARSNIAGTDRYLLMASLNPIRYFTETLCFE